MPGFSWACVIGGSLESSSEQQAFDFSTCSEHGSIALLPAAFLFLFGVPRVLRLCDKDRKTVRHSAATIYWAKAIAVFLLFSITMALSIMVGVKTRETSWANKSFIYTVVDLLSLVFVLVLHRLEYIRGSRASSIWRLFWLAKLTLRITQLRWLVLTKYYMQHIPEFVPLVIIGVLEASVFILELIPHQNTEYFTSESDDPLVTHDWKGWLKGADVHLHIGENLHDRDQARHMASRFDVLWRQELSKRNGKPSLSRTLRKLFGFQLLCGAWLKILERCIWFVQLWLLSKLMEFVDNQKSDRPALPQCGYAIAAAMFVTTIGRTFLWSQYIRIFSLVDRRIQYALLTAISKKALTLSDNSRDSSKAISENMAQKVASIQQLCNHDNIIWSGHVDIILSMYFLSTMLGISVYFSPVVIFLAEFLCIPLTRSAMHTNRLLRDNQNSLFDLISKAFGCIEVLKFFTWEKSLFSMIINAYNITISGTLIANRIFIIKGVAKVLASHLALLAAFGMYVLTKSNALLTPKLVFISLPLFRNIGMLMQFSNLSPIKDAATAIDHLQKYLSLEAKHQVLEMGCQRDSEGKIETSDAVNVPDVDLSDAQSHSTGSITGGTAEDDTFIEKRYQTNELANNNAPKTNKNVAKDCVYSYFYQEYVKLSPIMVILSFLTAMFTSQFRVYIDLFWTKQNDTSGAPTNSWVCIGASASIALFYTFYTVWTSRNWWKYYATVQATYIAKLEHVVRIMDPEHVRSMLVGLRSTFKPYTQLPIILYAWSISATYNTIILFTITFLTPKLFLVTVPIMVLYIKLGEYYVKIEHAFTRQHSMTVQRPHNHFQESESDLDQVKRYIQENEDLLNNVQAKDFVSLLLEYWFGVRFMFLNSIFIFFASLLSVVYALKKDNINASSVGFAIVSALSVDFFSCAKIFTHIYLHMMERSWLPISEPAKAQENSDTSTAWPEQGRIEFSGFSLLYQDGLKLIVQEKALPVSQQEKLLIIGKDRSALSTCHLVEPAGGKIQLCITLIARAQSANSRLAIIPKNPYFNLGSFRSVLDPERKFEDAELWRALEQTHLKDFVSSLDGQLNARINHPDLTLKYRILVCLACALLRPTVLLIFDEVTTGIDASTRQLIQSIIFQEFQHCTVLTNTCYSDMVLHYDRVLVSEQEKIVEIGAPQTLLSSPDSKLYQLYN